MSLLGDCCSCLQPYGHCVCAGDPPLQLELDFDSDEPLPVCPTRSNGDDTCESCQ